MSEWWRTDYPFRRSLIIDSMVADPIVDPHPVKAVIPLNTISSRKAREDFEDIEVVKYDENTSSFEVLGRHITIEDSTVIVEFPISNFSGISLEQYYIYFGNRNLINAPSRPSYEPMEWPLQVGAEERGFSYSNPGVDWVGGKSVKPGSHGAFAFPGGRIRIVGKKGPGYGKVRFTLDDYVSEEVDCYASQSQSDQVLYLNETLFDAHSSEVDARWHTISFEVLNDKPALSTSFGVEFQRAEYERTLIVTVQKEETGSHLSWTSVFIGS